MPAPPLTCPACLRLDAATRGIPAPWGTWLPCIACRVLNKSFGVWADRPTPFPTFTQRRNRAHWSKEEVEAAVTEWIAVYRRVPDKAAFCPAQHLPSYFTVHALYTGLEAFYAVFAGGCYAEAYQRFLWNLRVASGQKRHGMPLVVPGWTRVLVDEAVQVWMHDPGHQGRVPMTKHFECGRQERLPSASTLYRLYGGLRELYEHLDTARDDGWHVAQFLAQWRTGERIGGRRQRVGRGKKPQGEHDA